MSDTFIYEDSNEPQITLEPFVQKQWVWALDQNAGSYSGGQVLLDTSSLSNSGKYVAYSEAFFVIPIVMRMSATSANAQVSSIRNARSAFAAGLKSGYFQFLYSATVEYNNTSVVQLVPNLHHYVNYKLLTSFSQESLEKYGALIGFYPDSFLSCKYGAQIAADPNGHGVLNNRDLPQFPATVYTWDAVNSQANNEGYFWRQKNTTALDPTSPSAISTFMSPSQAGQYGLNYFRIGTGGDVDSKYWFVTAIIRLKDMADFFDKLPLVKGAFVRFTLNLNLATHNFTMSTIAGAVSDMSVTQNILTNGNSPLMITNAGQAGNGMYELGTLLGAIGDGTYSFSLTANVGRDPQTLVQHPTLNGVRLYAPLYTFNPVQEEAYLSLNKIKTIRYHDLYNYTIDVSCTGTPGSLQGQVTALLTNGVPNPQYLILIPYVAAGSNNTGNATAAISAYGSPFASEPGTSSCGITLTDLNVQVAGVNIFTQNELYSWENFTEELALNNAINGSQVDGLNSGLISYQSWNNNYRYYTVNISRRLPAENAVPKSIQVTATVLSGSIERVQLQAFLVWGREIAIDLETGAKIA